MAKTVGGRRTRKANMWAKAAGEYYRSHKNDPKIKEFRDVLKSPDFKKYYLSKYGKGSQKKFTRSNTKTSKYQKGEPEEEVQEEIQEEGQEEINEPMKITKKGKKNGKKNSKKSQMKEEDNEWKWGGLKKGGDPTDAQAQLAAEGQPVVPVSNPEVPVQVQEQQQ